MIAGTLIEWGHVIAMLRRGHIKEGILVKKEAYFREGFWWRRGLITENVLVEKGTYYRGGIGRRGATFRRGVGREGEIL